MDEISLRIGQRTFTCRKDELCHRSEYFRAMFAHEFIEKDKNEIILNDVDEQSFQFILEAKTPPSLKTVEEVLAVLKVSSMLQFDVETEAYEKFLLSNCLDLCPLKIMIAAYETDRINLYKRASAYSLWNFNELTASNDFESLPFTYLLRYLDDDRLRLSTSEMDVFKSITFWSAHNEPEEDIVMMLLKTIRFKCVSLSELQEMEKSLLISKSNTLSILLKELIENKKGKRSDKSLSSSTYNKKTPEICTLKFSDETLSQFFVKSARTLNAIPCTVVPSNLLIPEDDANFATLYGFNGKELAKILTLATEPFSETFIGFKVISVGFKLYLFGGEHGYGTGKFNMAVWSYDFISENWHYECQILQQRRHFAITVLDDCVFLLGGTGRYRKVLKTIEKYSIKTKAWSTCTKLINGNSFAPAVCTFHNKIYIVEGSGRMFYSYNPYEDIFNYIPIDLTNLVGLRFIAIYHDYLYGVEGSRAKIFRWKIFNNLDELILAENVGTFCHEGDSVLVNDSIYHFSYVEEKSLCCVEQLSLNSLKIDIVCSYPYKSSRISQYVFNGSFILPNYFLNND